MADTLTLLAVLIALLIGLAAGKAWERYKLRDGRWIDRRRARESPHYILGLNFLVSDQLDLAIDELTMASEMDPDALEVHLILGNLYREKGQVSKAIQVHQNLLQRPRLTTREHACVLLCLGLNFRRGGFIDRAFEAFSEVIRLDPGNQYALLNLEKLHEEQHQWREAQKIRQQITSSASVSNKYRDQYILAFLENELGSQAMRAGKLDQAIKHFKAAIDLDKRTVPAYLNLGDVRNKRGEVNEAIDAWKEVAKVAPERAYLAFSRLEAAFVALEATSPFIDLCRRLIKETPQDWRARLALGQHFAAHGEPTHALDLLFESLVHNPHALAIHQAIWRILIALNFNKTLVRRYTELTRDAVFYLDPHICMHCRYRSTELLWQCPQCHEWNTFVEERITPAEENMTKLQEKN
jgi:lipopolysaccharide biosynthesis regulator YciM